MGWMWRTPPGQCHITSDRRRRWVNTTLLSISRRVNTLKPHSPCNGAKLIEFSMGRTATALTLLLASRNGRGGGDWAEHELIGSWAGDQIVVAGDYADSGQFLTEEQLTRWRHEKGVPSDESEPTLYEYAHEFFRDISKQAGVMVHLGE